MVVVVSKMATAVSAERPLVVKSRNVGFYSRLKPICFMILLSSASSPFFLPRLRHCIPKFSEQIPLRI